MYLTMDFELDEQIMTPKRSGFLDRLLGLKIETSEDLEEPNETIEQDG